MQEELASRQSGQAGPVSDKGAREAAARLAKGVRLGVRLG
jgi:hypothetical protein